LRKYCFNLFIIEPLPRDSYPLVLPDSAVLHTSLRLPTATANLKPRYPGFAHESATAEGNPHFDRVTLLSLLLFEKFIIKLIMINVIGAISILYFSNKILNLYYKNLNKKIKDVIKRPTINIQCPIALIYIIGI
jgi:hypothetical protein